MSDIVKLVYKGKPVPPGEQPDRWFNGVPARDIDATEFATFGIDAAVIANITGGDDPLYVVETRKPEKPDKAEKSG